MSGEVQSPGGKILTAGLALVDMTDDLVVPAPQEKETYVTGFPEGSWLNYVLWSDDSKHLAFTVRSSGDLLP